MTKHAFDHGCEILVELRRHLVRRQTLGDLRKSAHVVKQHRDLLALSAQCNSTGRVRDVFCQLRGEVTLEILAHTSRVAQPHRGLFALHCGGGNARVRDQEVEVRIGEGIGITQVVGIQHAQRHAPIAK